MALNRITPQLAASELKTYQILAPVSTHFRNGTCQEAQCLANQHGWKTTIDTSSELGQRQAHYIRKDSGRRFTEECNGPLVTFSFHSGQRCFTEHKISLEREPVYLVKDGDFRGNPRGTAPRRHQSAANWVEDFTEHQQKVADAIEKG